MITPKPWLRGHVAGTLLMLVIEFMFGMLVNLYVGINPAHPGDSGGYFGRSLQSVSWAVAHGPVALQLHALLGLLLGVSALVLLGRAIARRRASLITATAVGALGIIAAGFNGASFLDFADLPVSSLIMSAGFAVATLAYISALLIGGRDPQLAT